MTKVKLIIEEQSIWIMDVTMDIDKALEIWETMTNEEFEKLFNFNMLMAIRISAKHAKENIKTSDIRQKEKSLAIKFRNLILKVLNSKIKKYCWDKYPTQEDVDKVLDDNIWTNIRFEIVP